MSKINFQSLLSYHNKNKSCFTVATSEHNIQNPFGTIKLNKNRITEFKEKPINKSIICTGAYVMDAKFLDKWCCSAWGADKLESIHKKKLFNIYAWV